MGQTSRHHFATRNCQPRRFSASRDESWQAASLSCPSLLGARESRNLCTRAAPTTLRETERPSCCTSLSWKVPGTTNCFVPPPAHVGVLHPLRCSSDRALTGARELSARAFAEQSLQPPQDLLAKRGERMSGAYFLYQIDKGLSGLVTRRLWCLLSYHSTRAWCFLFVLKLGVLIFSINSTRQVGSLVVTLCIHSTTA